MKIRNFVHKGLKRLYYEGSGRGLPPDTVDAGVSGLFRTGWRIVIHYVTEPFAAVQSTPYAETLIV